MSSHDLFDQKGKTDASPASGTEQEQQGLAVVETGTDTSVDLSSSEITVGGAARQLDLDSPDTDVLGSLEVVPDADTEVTVNTAVKSAVSSALEKAVKQAGIDLSQFDIDVSGVKGVVSDLGAHLSPTLSEHIIQLQQDLGSAYGNGQIISKVEEVAGQEPDQHYSVELLTRNIESFVALVGSKSLVELGDRDESV